MNKMMLTDEDQQMLTMMALKFKDMTSVYNTWRRMGTKRYQLGEWTINGTTHKIDRDTYPVLSDEELQIFKKVRYCNMQVR